MDTDKLITRFRDLLFGRPRIKVINRSPQDSLCSKPIFIIGTFRSGTTLLRYIIDSHSNICCPAESKFLEPLSQLHDLKRCKRAFDFMGFDESYVKKEIKSLADNFFCTYMMAHNKTRWADKTPEYVRILDFIEWLYGPNCQYILIYRNGLDVANSMHETELERFGPDQSLDYAYRYWAHDTQIMADWEDRYPSRCFSLNYESLTSNLTEVLQSMFDFLEEPWDDQVLQWYSKGHDRGDEDIKARRQRGIKISFENFKSWPPETISKYKKSAAKLHKRVGYDPVTLLPSK